MGKQYEALSEEHIAFIQTQKLFFVGTATADSRVNISPKGMDSFRVMDQNRIIWLNVTGSGNETSAHVQVNPRMTVMFCAFEGVPRILRLYGQARVVHQSDENWNALSAHFPRLPGARQIFDLDIDLVQISCGMAVPNFAYVDDRELLSDWATKRGSEGVAEYWEEKNQFSIDQIPTNILNRDF